MSKATKSAREHLEAVFTHYTEQPASLENIKELIENNGYVKANLDLRCVDISKLSLSDSHSVHALIDVIGDYYEGQSTQWTTFTAQRTHTKGSSNSRF